MIQPQPPVDQYVWETDWTRGQMLGRSGGTGRGRLATVLTYPYAIRQPYIAETLGAVNRRQQLSPNSHR